MRTARFMRTTAVVLTATILGIVLVAAAVADEKGVTEPRRARVLNDYPDMSFLAGSLTIDSVDGWMINETRVMFGAESRLLDPERDAQIVNPRSGQLVQLMGSWVGTTFLVREGTVQHQETTQRGKIQEKGVELSTEDQTVGWCDSGPQ